MAIDLKLIDKLLAGYKKPEDIIGKNGLLRLLDENCLQTAALSALSKGEGLSRDRERASC